MAKSVREIGGQCSQPIFVLNSPPHICEPCATSATLYRAVCSPILRLLILRLIETEHTPRFAVKRFVIYYSFKSSLRVIGRVNVQLCISGESRRIDPAAPLPHGRHSDRNASNLHYMQNRRQNCSSCGVFARYTRVAEALPRTSHSMGPAAAWCHVLYLSRTFLYPPLRPYKRTRVSVANGVPNSSHALQCRGTTFTV